MFVFHFDWHVFLPPVLLSSVGKRALSYLAGPSSHVTSFMKLLLTHLPPSKLDHSLHVCCGPCILKASALVIRTFIALVFIKANQITVRLVAQGNYFLSASHRLGAGYKEDEMNP